MEPEVKTPARPQEGRAVARPKVTVDWLRGQVLDLLEIAKQAEEVDHAACAQYLKFLFAMTPEMDRKTEVEPVGRDVRRAAWREASEKHKDTA